MGIDALTDGTMAEALGEMALAGAARAGNTHGDLLGDIATGGEFIDQSAVEVGQAGEIESVEGFARAESGATLRLSLEQDFMI